MNINTITAEDLRRMPDKEGLILQGCGGDLTEWVDGINEMLTNAGILKDGSQFENVFAFQHGELTCLLYPFDDVKLDIGKLAPVSYTHLISQRVCRRNTDETRIVLLKVWKELYELSPTLFAPSLTGPFCQMDRCLEGKMTCGRKLQANMTPEDILEKDYPALWEGDCR